MIKSNFKDWYDYLLVELKNNHIIYNRLTLQKKIEDKDNNFKNQIFKDTGIKFDRFFDEDKEQCFNGIWIGVFPYIYLCPTTLWTFKKIEISRWKDIVNETTDFSNWKKYFPDSHNVCDYDPFFEKYSKISSSKRWFTPKYERGTAFLKECALNIKNIEWDNKALTYKLYLPEFFYKYKSPIIAASLNFKYLILNPNLTGFKFFLEENSKIWSPAPTPKFSETYFMLDEMKGGFIDIEDRLSEYLTAANEPIPSVQTDEQKIVSNGFDLKTSFRGPQKKKK